MHGVDADAAARAGAPTRSELVAVAAEQTAQRRVAELVARGVPSAEVFTVVTTEASTLLNDAAVTLASFDGERELVVVATCGGPAPVGARIVFEAETLPDRVRCEDRVTRVDDCTQERDPQLAARLGIRAAVAAPISVSGAVWGMLAATSPTEPLPAGVEDRLRQFAELVAAALANSRARAELQALLDEQTALRRIAELIAQEAPAAAVLNAVAVQASRLAGVEFGMVHRFEPDGSTEIMALDGAPENFAVGMRAPEGGDGSIHRVWRTGRAARVDDLGKMSGQWPRMANQYGFSRSAGVPVYIQGRLWGSIIVVGRDALLPPAIETQLNDFAEIVSTAIAAAQARAELRVLADEQAALRRVAELAAHGATLDEVFTAVTVEASTLLGEPAALLRYEPDDRAVVVAEHDNPAPPRRRVGRTDLARELDRGAGPAVPVVVEGRVWGTLMAGTSGSRLPEGAEDRLTQFAELAAAAIANAENKAKLTASRARVIATADETRRRLQRDLHDGAQQRLVHTLIALKLAREAAAEGRQAVDLIDEALANVDRANSELRDLVRGILPASLTRGGLAAGLGSLVADVSLPVDLRVSAPRLAAHTETTAYFIVAEALTNVVKHAHATRATVDVALDGNRLSVLVRDDGTGGADSARGSGLTGLSDRVDAHDGTLSITSPLGAGTTVHATLPLVVPSG